MKAVLRDSSIAVALVFVVLAFLLCPGNTIAQTQTAPSPARNNIPRALPRDPDEPPLTSIEEELHAKRAIKFAEKVHRENLDRAREIAEIGKGLRESFKNKSSIDREFLKKLDRLEKLTKKVREEAGGDDQEVTITDRPSDINSAVTQIADVSESFSKDVKNTPRQVVSSSVIGSANVLLELIRMLRTFTRQP